MAAGVYNVEFNRGETFTRIINYVDINSDAINITGFLAHLTIRPSLDASKPALYEFWGSSSQGVGLTITNPLAGQITWSLTPFITQSFPVARANYDLFLYTPEGNRIKLLRGGLTIRSSVTVAV